MPEITTQSEVLVVFGGQHGKEMDKLCKILVLDHALECNSRKRTSFYIDG